MPGSPRRCSAALGAPLAPVERARFPLRAHTGGLATLGGDSGEPVLLQGDAAWSLISALTPTDALQYLDDRRARGFNALLCSAVEAHFCPSATPAPQNRAGVAAFTTANDFATPSTAFFDHVEWVIARARERGIYVFLCPLYFGFSAGAEGWYQRFSANGPAKVQSFCAYLAARLAAYTNVVWVLGGDYTPPDATYLEAMWAGIVSASPGSLAVTLHMAPESDSTARTGAWTLTVNSGYAYPPGAPAHMHGIYGDGVPTILAEGRYENEQGVTRATLRAQAYCSVLCGGNGHIYGCAPVWYFGVPGDGNPGHAFADDGAQPWTAWLASVGAQDVERWGAFFRARRWFYLRPDVSDSLVTAGKGSGATYVAAARTDDGLLAVAYLPTSAAVTLNTSLLACGSGTSMTAKWVDPTTGAATNIGTYTTGGSRVFTPTGNNAAGAPDWVLVVEP